MRIYRSSKKAVASGACSYEKQFREKEIFEMGLKTK